MKYCPNCGKEVNGAFCSNCGRKIDGNTNANNNTQYNSSLPYNSPKYRPISAWGYLGYDILFAIPIIGFILLIVYSVIDDNINVRNYARSYWCKLIVIFAVFFIVGLIVALLGANFD